FDPVAIRIEDHRYPRDVSKRHRCKPFADALASQLVMHGVDIGDLQRDVAPAACLTNRIDGRRTVFIEKDKAVAQAKGRTSGPGLLGKAEDVAIEPPVFAEAADPHGDGYLGDAIATRRHQLNR